MPPRFNCPRAHGGTSSNSAAATVRFGLPLCASCATRGATKVDWLGASIGETAFADALTHAQECAYENSCCRCEPKTFAPTLWQARAARRGPSSRYGASLLASSFVIATLRRSPPPRNLPPTSRLPRSRARPPAACGARRDSASRNQRTERGALSARRPAVHGAKLVARAGSELQVQTINASRTRSRVGVASLAPTSPASASCLARCVDRTRRVRWIRMQSASTPTPTPTPPPTPTCTEQRWSCAAWGGGHELRDGVSLWDRGKAYIATHDNPDYDPSTQHLGFGHRISERLLPAAAAAPRRVGLWAEELRRAWAEARATRPARVGRATGSAYIATHAQHWLRPHNEGHLVLVAVHGTRLCIMRWRQQAPPWSTNGQARSGAPSGLGPGRLTCRGCSRLRRSAPSWDAPHPCGVHIFIRNHVGIVRTPFLRFLWREGLDLTQFLPGTWASFAVMPNGNGTNSPFEIFPPDAMMAQGR